VTSNQPINDEIMTSNQPINDEQKVTSNNQPINDKQNNNLQFVDGIEMGRF